VDFFDDREQAGKLLAKELSIYRGGSVAVIALSEGAILVAAEIAKKIHSSLFIFASQRADSEAVGLDAAINSGGAFSYNTSFTLGQYEEQADEARLFKTQRSMWEFQKLNHVAGRDGTIPKQMLKRHVVILVSDGLNSALSLEIAADFLHPLDIKKLVIATPIASLEAVDKMHILVDQIFCLKSVEDYISTSHYYRKSVIPDDKTVVKIMQNIVLNWNNEKE